MIERRVFTEEEEEHIYQWFAERENDWLEKDSKKESENVCLDVDGYPLLEISPDEYRELVREEQAYRGWLCEFPDHGACGGHCCVNCVEYNENRIGGFLCDPE